MTRQKPIEPAAPRPAVERALPWTQRLSLTVAIGAASLALTLLVVMLLRAAELTRFTMRFQDQAREHIAEVRRTLEHEVELLRAVAAVIDASESVRAPHFERVIERGLGADSDFVSISYLRRVPGIERAAFEAAADGGDSLHPILELDPSGKLVPAARRPEHFPVALCISRLGDAAERAELGLDYASMPTLRDAMDQALRSATMVAAGPLTIDHRGESTIYLFQPLYAGNDVPASEAEREMRLEGFAVAVLPIEATLRRVLAAADLNGMRLQVWAGESEQALQPVYGSDLEVVGDALLAELEADSLSYSLPWSLGGMRWCAVALPSTHSRSRDGVQWSWLALALGLLLTAGVTTAAARVSGERRRLSHEVRQFWRLSAELLAVADRQGVLRRINPAWSALHGGHEDELLGRSIIDLIHPEDRVATIALLSKLRSATATLQFEARLQGGNGRWRWFQWSAAPDEASDSVHLVAHDVTEQRQTLAELERRATIDPLTNVLTRRALFERLGLEIRRAKRYSAPLSLAVLDLDQFKEVNDHHGHGTGDEMLRRLGQLLRKSLRETDLAGRIGGDEFVVVMPQTDLDDARRAAARLLRALHDDPGIPTDGGARLPVRASLGVATLGPDVKDATALVALADDALYDAKGKGRGRVA